METAEIRALAADSEMAKLAVESFGFRESVSFKTLLADLAD